MLQFNFNHFYSKIILLALILLGVMSVASCNSIGMLNPKGIVTFEERRLFFDTLALMLIVVLPVIIMSLAFVYHYQASHQNRDYKPNWSHSYFLEALWWGIPVVIITILAVLTWKKTYQLDPFRPINNTQPLVVQAIALPWKWLFIYPQQGVASLNYLLLPQGQQVEFMMTTDNVAMSALFIPQLGSQIYAMAGMRSRLHLLANQLGDYDGLNTQYNGDGFSSMHFQVKVVTPQQMQAWFQQAQLNTNVLSDAAYTNLLKHSIGAPPVFYSGASAELFDKVIMLYMNTYGTVHPRQQINAIDPTPQNQV